MINKEKLKLKIENIKFYIKQPYRNLRNRILAKRYPWLVPFTGWEGDKETYKYSKAESLWAEPDYGGWNKSFFYLLMEDIRKAAKKAGIINQLHTGDYKSKYGGLRFYMDGYNDEIATIIHTYEMLSEHICEMCGEPDVGYTGGWITPICESCYNKGRYNTKSYYEAISRDRRMPDKYSYIKYSPNNEKETIEVDITKTANRIRKKWNRKHPFKRKKTYA